MTPAQRILASVRNTPPAPPPIAPPPPATPPTDAIDAAKQRLAPGVPLESWLRSADSPPPAMYLAPSTVTVSGASFTDAHPRVPFSDATYDPCGDDLPRLPTVWVGLAAGWPSLRSGWNAPVLAARCAPGELFAVDGGPGFARNALHAASVPMAAYAAYAAEEGAARGDVAPLYIFDAQLSTRRFADGAPFSAEFSVPACLSHDEMAKRGGADTAAARPLPARWLLVGAAGSGTPIHNHPLTAAWNTLLCGVKLWVVLPPNAPPEALLLGDACPAEGDEDLSAAAWVRHWGGALPAGAQVIVQRAGETVFLPAAWWHVVLNVASSTAVSSSVYLRRDWEELGAAAVERGECEGFARVFRAEAARA